MMYHCLTSVAGSLNPVPLRSSTVLLRTGEVDKRDARQGSHSNLLYSSMHTNINCKNMPRMSEAAADHCDMAV